MTPTGDLLALRVKTLGRFFATQGFAYWAMCLYLLVEYVRPQQLYRPLYAVPVAQIVLGAALLGHVGAGRWFGTKGLGTWLLLIYTAVIVVSSLTAYRPDIAMDQWRLWFSWVAIYFLIINVVDTEQRLVFFVLLWLVFNYYMAQGGARQFAHRGFTFELWGVVGAPGWFNNSGEFGVAMCMFLAVAWHYFIAARPFLKGWRKLIVVGMPVTAIVGIVGSSSRGALVGLAAVGLWELLQGKHRVRIALGVASLSAGVWLLLPPEQKARLSEAGSDYTSQTRKTYWRNGLDMARNDPAFGIGYANWTAYYSDHYVDPGAPSYSVEGRVQVAHNIFIQCVAELGYVGLVVLVLLIFATLWINYRTRSWVRAVRGPPNRFLIQLACGLDAAMIGYLASGFFVTVLYYPFFWINLALTVALSAIARRQYRDRQVAPKGRGVLAGRSRLGVAAPGTPG